MCIESHQRDEFSGGRGEWEIVDTLRSLSAGVRLRHRLDVLNAQLEAGMRAYLAGRNVIDLDLTTVFDRDPVAELNDTHGFLIDVRLPEPSELIRSRLEGSQQTFDAWENLRQRLIAERVTYEQQFAREHTGYLRGARELVVAHFEALTRGEATAWSRAGAEPLLHQLHMWTSIGGDPAEFATFGIDHDWGCEVFPSND
jgi:hypothetical protein